jgi:hypothetical protein
MDPELRRRGKTDQEVEAQLSPVPVMNDDILRVFDQEEDEERGGMDSEWGGDGMEVEDEHEWLNYLFE